MRVWGTPRCLSSKGVVGEGDLEHFDIAPANDTIQHRAKPS